MTKTHFMKSAIGVAIVTLIAACGGSENTGSAANNGRTNPSNVDDKEPALIIGSIKDSAIIIGATFPFSADTLPKLRIVEIVNGNIVEPDATAVAIDLGKALTPNLTVIGKTADGKDIKFGEPTAQGAPKRVYLVTLSSAEQSPYFSPTRNTANESCAENTQTSGRLCSAETGRREGLNVTFRAIFEYTPAATGTTLPPDANIVNVGPLSSLVTERVRFLRTPTGSAQTSTANATFNQIKEQAELELSTLLLGGSTINTGDASTPTTVTPIASIPPRANPDSASPDLLGSSRNATVHLAQGVLERLAQQMFRSAQQTDASSGYSSMYSTLFSSFARDGRFESGMEDVQGGSVGLRSTGALLNSALTEHLIKDAPRYIDNSIVNFRLADFVSSPAARTIRNSLSINFPDLYAAASGAAASVSYVSKDAAGKPRDRIITAVAARSGGIFFLDSRGEAQDGSKPAVRCSTETFKLPGYEVTGVAALEGAAAPLMLAYSHTDTRAILIDVRQVGLDAATQPGELICALTDRAFRVVDFRDVGQNASLYQNAAQYQHTRDGESASRPVTLTGAAYNALENRLKITTLDGILSFDVVPSGTPSDLPFQTRFNSFVAFGDGNGSKDAPGLSMNPSFDNTKAVFDGSMSRLTSLFSPFDYNNSNSGYDRSLAGVYRFGLLGELASPGRLERGVFTDIERPVKQVPLTGSLARNFGTTGVALSSDLDEAAVTDTAANTAAKLANNCLDPREPFKRFAAPLNNFAQIKIFEASQSSVDGGSAIGMIPPINALLPRPRCENPNNFTLSVRETADNATYPDSGDPGIRRQEYICLPNSTGGGGGLPLLGGGTQPQPVQPVYDVTASVKTRQIDTPDEVEQSPLGTVTAERQFGGCKIGYHGAALENRYANRSSIDAIAVAIPGQNLQTRGLVNATRLKTAGNPAKVQKLVEEDSKPFAILKSDSTADKRALVLDGIRSYGVIRQRGTFSKPLAYFVAKETDPNKPKTYSLIEVDIDAVRLIQNPTVESTAYKIPTTSAESREFAGPIRVYFR